MFRKLQRQLDRRTAGRGSSKFIFDTTVTSLDGIPPHVKFCQIAWTRGAKEQRTEVVPVQKGRKLASKGALLLCPFSG